MWPYFAVIFIILILQIKLRGNSNSKVNCIIAFIVLFCFAAFRGNGDGDYFTYLSFSTYVTSIDKVLTSSIPMEIGFRLISYLVNVTGIHQQFVIIIMNLISLTCIYKFVQKYSPDKMLSVLFFLPLYFQYDMHTARTAVAIGIATLGFRYIYEKRLVKYLAVILLASFFHKSAIILLPMYFIGNIKIDKYWGILSTLVLSVLTSLISFSGIILMLLRLFRMNSFAYKYSSYMQSMRFGHSFKLYDPRFILVIGTYIIAKIILDDSDKMQNLLMNFVWVNALLIIIFREHTIFVMRLTSYFNIYTIILIPYIVSYFKSNKNMGSYYLAKLASIYVYIPYIIALSMEMVEYKLFFI